MVPEEDSHQPTKPLKQISKFARIDQKARGKARIPLQLRGADRREGSDLSLYQSVSLTAGDGACLKYFTHTIAREF